MDFNHYNFYLFCPNKPFPTYLDHLLKPVFTHLTDRLKTTDIYPDLIINFSHEELGEEILELYPNVPKAGLTSISEGLTQGRWAQTLFTQLSINSFKPFTAYDLFYRALTGQCILPRESGANNSSRIYFDLESFQGTGFNTELVMDLLKKNYQVVTSPSEIEDIKLFDKYIGASASLMKIFGFYGAECIYFTANPNDPFSAAPFHSFVLGFDESFITLEDILNSTNQSKSTEWTRDSLAGSLLISKEETQSPTRVFDLLNYIIFNFINSNIDANIPLATVSENDRVYLQNTISFTKKIHQLNLFALKELNEFLDTFNKGNLKNEMIENLKKKITEIDQLTESSINSFHCLDFFNTYYKIAKTSAHGENMVEIAQSLILIYHEMNQVIEVYEELILKIIQGVKDEHTKSGHA